MQRNNTTFPSNRDLLTTIVQKKKIHLNISEKPNSLSCTSFPPRVNAAAFANIITEPERPNDAPKAKELQIDFLQDINSFLIDFQKLF